MWKMCGCYQKGRGHLRMKMPCQDKIATLSKNRVKVIALSDGAGSAAFSQEGAGLIVTGVTEYIAEHFDEMFSSPKAGAVKTELLDYLRNDLQQKAEELGCEFRALAATLLFVAIKNDKYLIGHLGDGIIGYLKDGEIKVASRPDNGEYANTTYFVTSSSCYMKLRLMKGSLGTIDGFVLMSDGCGDSFYYSKENRLVSVLSRIMRWYCVLGTRVFKKILSQMFSEVIVKKTTDDCSMVMITKDYREEPLLVLEEKEYEVISEYAALDRKERKTSDVIG